ncbi:hypothetical protein HG535_0A02340 [Zygotorulaspora mrakii]|uniref:J domain-containing protein n=1 Tax=Zygotorulaspora mrakii TaxID=42260 RepID=A0A7H9AVE9_ZYGMR|nr:uncharacterized protein HG535_0A02340 [Zygotorulaspora mrakii]QLG70296.1 hypothetical protein HG535_0A02340 [Zygotorulaspora mrakii]
MLLQRNVPFIYRYRRACTAQLKTRSTLSFSKNVLIKLNFRFFAIPANYAESHNEGGNVHHDTRWPNHENPTPYEVFGITQQECSSSRNINKSILKKRFHEYAKLYHPDISQNVRIIRSPIKQKQLGGSLLSFDEKVLRFKIMTQAYEILSDTGRRNLYDLTKSNWAYGPQSSSTYASSHAYPSSHGYQTNSTYEYWNAGTWEEMNDLNKGTQEREKLDPWTVFLWLCGLVVCLEATALLTRIENSLTSQQYTHEETEFDLAQSYSNYGLDSDKFSRLRRFLWFRTYGLYRAKDDLDREAEKNEGLVQDLIKATAEKDNGACKFSASKK